MCAPCAGGFLTIAKALGLAAVKAVVCISAIILTGRTLLRPVMRRIASLENAEIFAATTLLIILGCSALTQLSGLSQALGAFLAGLLMAETEYVLQVRPPVAHAAPALLQHSPAPLALCQPTSTASRPSNMHSYASAIPRCMGARIPHQTSSHACLYQSLRQYWRRDYSRILCDAL